MAAGVPEPQLRNQARTGAAAAGASVGRGALLAMGYTFGERTGSEATLIPQSKIEAAVERLAHAARPVRILLFGSYARGDATDASDLDLLVIEAQLDDRAAELVRLRRELRPLRIPVDLLVFSSKDVARWGDQPGSALFHALREGKVVYG